MSSHCPAHSAIAPLNQALLASLSPSAATLPRECVWLWQRLLAGWWLAQWLLHLVGGGCRIGWVLAVGVSTIDVGVGRGGRSARTGCRDRIAANKLHPVTTPMMKIELSRTIDCCILSLTLSAEQSTLSPRDIVGLSFSFVIITIFR